MSGAAAVIARREVGTGANRINPTELIADHSTVMDATNKVSQGLKVRLPSIFGGHTNFLDASQPNAKLLQADLPGFCYTMETLLDDDAGKNIPTSIYMYSVPQAGADALHNSIQQAAPGATWVDAPAVGTIAVKTLKSAGDMEFSLKGAIERLPATVDVYSFDAGANRVVIGWRVANSVATKYKFPGLITASMATAQLDVPGAVAPMPMPMPMP